MSAGLPGAGLGAFLYTVMILLMPLFSIFAVRRSAGGWKSVARHFGLLLSMILVAWLESEIAVLLGLLSPSKLVRFLPLFLLLIVFATLELLRWIYRRPDRNATEAA
jgi:hypothetical protein